MTGGPMLKEIFFRLVRPQLGLKIRWGGGGGEGRALLRIHH